MTDSVLDIYRKGRVRIDDYPRPHSSLAQVFARPWVRHYVHFNALYRKNPAISGEARRNFLFCF